MKLKILDLFSGLGGFSLGLERTGCFKTIAFCDNNKFSKLILDKHWKGIKIYDDIREITKEKFKTDGIESPDIITGGFPCQPFSVAGKQKGTSDDRHLWPEMFRIIKAFKPRFVIGENVRGIINIQDGVVFETVCTDLESEGYEVQPFIIPAAGVGAPHRRERVWIIAIREESMVNSDNVRFKQYSTTEEEASRRRSSATFEPTGSADMENARRTLQQRTEFGKTNEDEIRKENANINQRSSSSSESDVADTESERLQRSRGQESDRDINGLQQNSKRIESEIRSESERCGRTFRNEKLADTHSERLEGFRQGSREFNETSATTSRGEERQGNLDQGWWSVEPNVGRVAHGVSGRVHRLRALGNSIIPQIAEEIGRAIIKAMK